MAGRVISCPRNIVIDGGQPCRSAIGNARQLKWTP
jgi:hypothetical protein